MANQTAWNGTDRARLHGHGEARHATPGHGAAVPCRRAGIPARARSYEGAGVPSRASGHISTTGLSGGGHGEAQRGRPVQPRRRRAGATAALGGGGGEVGEDELRLAGDATWQRQGTPPPRSHAGCAPALVAAAAAKARRPSRAAARRRGCGGGDGGVRGRGPSSRTGGRERRGGSGRRGERRCGGRGGAALRLRPEGERRGGGGVGGERSDASGDAGVHGPRPCRPVQMP